MFAAPATADAPAGASASIEQSVSLPPLPPSPPASAAPSGKCDTGDTAWVMMSAALVMLMMPGLAFFYGGLVRKKNVLSILMQCMMILCVVSVLWATVGYSLAFGGDVGGFIGDLKFAMLRGVSGAPSDYAGTIPHSIFMMFQAMFAIITPALIIGAFAERMRFGPFVLFTVAWSLLVYCPVAHWIWGKGGWLAEMGMLDFAGGTVVHVNAGMGSLAAALYLGRRKGFPHQISPPHNLPFAVLGAGLLWFGWFGFNGGSALGANETAANAFMSTHIAAAVAGLTWATLDWLRFGRPTMLGMITGAVAGLATITQGAGYVDASGAMLIGLAGGVVCWCSVTMAKTRLGYDDSLDAFGVHGVGGILGGLLVGLLATRTGWFYTGNPHQFMVQGLGVGVTMAYVFVVSLVLLRVVAAISALRVTSHEESVGLDLTQHRESGYTVID
jgi:Amt family ammonium transporter